MTRKARKFQITDEPCPDYEKLINDPLIQLIELDKFSNFGNYFVVVHYYDLNPRRDEEEAVSDGSDTSADA